MKIENKLKPCPFCGDTMRLHGWRYNWCVVHLHWNKCNFSFNGRLKKDILKRWNRRATK